MDISKINIGSGKELIEVFEKGAKPTVGNDGVRQYVVIDPKTNQIRLGSKGEALSFKQITELTQAILAGDKFNLGEKANVLESYKKITKNFEESKLGFFEEIFFKGRKVDQVSEAKKSITKMEGKWRKETRTTRYSLEESLLRKENEAYTKGIREKNEIKQEPSIKAEGVTEKPKSIGLVANVLDEIRKTEQTFFDGAKKLQNFLDGCCNKYPKDKFLNQYKEKLDSAINNFDAFNDEINHILNSDLDPTEKSEKLAQLYSTGSEDYFNSLSELTSMFKNFNSWQKEHPQMYKKLDDADQKALSQGSAHPIIFAQRAPRHQLLMGQLINEGNDFFLDQTKKTLSDAYTSIQSKANEINQNLPKM